MEVEVYKRDNKEKSKKKRLLLLALLLLFVIYITLKFVKIPTTSELKITGEVPYETSQISEEPKQTRAKQCYMQEFNWAYTWQGWADLEEDYISPNFFIINYEDKVENFDIRFAFFDNTEHPYDLYRGFEYEDFKHELSGDDAKMHSKWITITLGPKENRTITIPTKAPNPDHTYWALVDVEAPPPYEVCVSEKIEEEELIKTQTVTAQKEEEETKVVKESVSLWDWLFGR